jgi:adenosylcobinamide-GDP ribazoletransferase
VGRLIAAGATEDGRLEPLADVAAAVALLTRVPVRGGRERAGAWAFGVVGLGLGLVAAVPLLAADAVGVAPAAVLALASLAVASGALHLDGLADTADALAAPTADAAERARRDPHAGAAGVVALVLVLGLDTALLMRLVDARGPFSAAIAVLAAVAASRAAAAVAPLLARGVGAWRDGFGGWFAERTSAVASLVAAASAAAIGLAGALAVGGPTPLAAALGGLGIGVAATLVLRRLRGAMEGDALGAVVELAFAGALLAAVLGR